jgi:hypothetical protein
MNTLIENLRKKFKKFWQKPKKEVVEGYFLMDDLSNNAFLLLVKTGERCWKTMWFSNDQYTYKQTDVPISEILRKQPLSEK